MELTPCYDCKKSISFTAAQCPYCGSTEPSGPYQANKREKGTYSIEARNDNTVIIGCLVGACVGALLGYLASPPEFYPLIMSLVMALMLTLVGLAIAFVINIVRSAKHRFSK